MCDLAFGALMDVSVPLDTFAGIVTASPEMGGGPASNGPAQPADPEGIKD